ncbi:hypothetical protein MLD38_021150 [Melastoma candidum]|uniref:Uncharacterized protein n=1 Tax=Melastoma candidum TaxID=119954 RepID=A0ACB9QIK9_9MYRT|nr:hypothetical protein MLD38_021150 [Melastoma candidum]
MVQSLWAATRKSNYDIHVLKAQADEADERFRAAASKVEKLIEIVSEEWIQIKNFEQALQFAEMRATNTRWESASRRCLFLKFFYNFFGCHQPEVLCVSNNIFRFDREFPSYKWEEALQQLKGVYSVVKDYHFELQSIIRREMERNEVTAALTNEELSVFVASAIGVFPLLSAWIWISSLLL